MNPFPVATHILDLLEALTDKKPVSVPRKPAPLNGNGRAPVFAGIYKTDSESGIDAALIVDFTVAVGCAAAMIKLGPSGVQEELKTQRGGEMLRPTLYEVLNIASSLLNASGHPHVRLTDLIEWQNQPPETVSALLAGEHQRLDLDLTFAPCPAGRVVLIRSN